jgi:hypothetical protein
VKPENYLLTYLDMKILIKKSFFCFIGLAFTHNLIWSQPSPCGTIVDNAQKSFEAAFFDSISTLSQLNRTINITLHITKSSEGATDVDIADVNQAISDANLAFDPIKVKFRIASIDTINNYQFDFIKQGTNDKDMIIRSYTARTVNLYLISQLNNSLNENICGYAYFPSAKKDVMVIRKDCLSGTFLIEQLGHIFNLYHTHETAFGVELTNKSNCATAGDKCCDTDADPNLSGKVNTSCGIVGLPGYTPSTHNYMSFSLPACKCYFTNQQYIRMIYTIVKYKSYLW